jgi:hypothetical protein
MCYYRQIIHDWVLHRTASADKASNAVRVALLAHLKEHAEVSKKGKWEPNEDSPHNKCKRRAYYYAPALELDWTMRRALLDVMENLEWSPGMWQCNEKAPACMLLVRYYRYIAKHKVHIYIHLSYLAYILLESPKRLEREAKCLYTCDN